MLPEGEGGDLEVSGSCVKPRQGAWALSGEHWGVRKGLTPGSGLTAFVSPNVASGANVENKLKGGHRESQGRGRAPGGLTSASHPLSSALGWTGCQSCIRQGGRNGYHL